jgi:hypothetical protein
VSGTPSLSFTTRRSPRRWLRGLIVLLVVILAVVVAVAAMAGLLWGYAWWRLGGTDVPALADDVEPLGSLDVTAPAGVTTTLVAFVEDRDPTLPGEPPLQGPVALVQSGGVRGDDVVVLLLPDDLPVTVDGAGAATLSEVHEGGGLDMLVRAVADYTEVRIDGVVRATPEALPQIVEAIGSVQACDPTCVEVDAEETRRRVAALTELDPGGDATTAVADVAAVLRGVAATTELTSVLRSPLVTRQVIDVVAGQVATDTSLRGGVLLTVAQQLAAPTNLVVLGVPAIRNLDTGELVVLPERAVTQFALLREGGLPDASDVDAATEVLRQTTVAVLNGTGTAGYAARLETRLQAEGVRVIGTGNAPSFDVATTSVAYDPDDPRGQAAALLLARLLGDDVEVVAGAGALTFEGDPVHLVVTGGADLDEDS